MTKDEALKLALMALEHIVANSFYQYAHQQVMRQPDNFINKAITDIKEALAKPEQKYHRGDRLICFETEEYCVIHISGADRQWVKFPDSHIGVYTNDQVAELFELLPKEPEQEPVAWMDKDGDVLSSSVVNGKGLRNIPLYTTPPQRKPLLDEFGYWWFEYGSGLFPLEGEDQEEHAYRVATAAWQAAHGIKGD